MLIFEDDIDFVSVGIAYKGALYSQFLLKFWENADLGFYKMKTHKNLHERYASFEIKIIHFSYI